MYNVKINENLLITDISLSHEKKSTKTNFRCIPGHNSRSDLPLECLLFRTYTWTISEKLAMTIKSS